MTAALFPHDRVRETQDVLLDSIAKAVETGTHRVIHAPTGLGKTAASLAAALAKSLKTNKTTFFLTPKHTQHKIALETIREIKKRHNLNVIGIDIIGKKHMCLQPSVKLLSTRDFAEYCKAMREDSKCQYYNNLKKNDDLSFNTKAAHSELKQINPTSPEETVDVASKYEVCPYEVAMILGKEAKLVITDYYYIFHPRIRNNFFTKINKELKDSIIIVDEAHNLPNRIKDLSSEKLSNYVLKRAISEADKYNKDELNKKLRDMLRIFEMYDVKMEQDEVYMRKETFINDIKKFADYEALADELEEAGDEIREDQKYSYIGSVALFMKSWPESDEGFTRIFSRTESQKEEILTLSYRCLDPGIISKPIIEEASSVILMSGTLTPTSMYSELLGFNKEITEEVTLKSPFPEQNRLNIIVPRTSTKFTTRSDEQYEEIAKLVTKAVNAIPGNSAVFFPSFKFRDDVYKFMKDCEKTVFIEKQGMTKQEKEEMLENYKGYKNTGATLLGVISGSFGEGIDLPGDFLKGVIVVGLPLQRPDLETKALIDYYDAKFKKGWDYGYVYPAFNKTLQSAGRCIRSETDRGVILFIDERYEWPRYKECFPPTWEMKTTLLFESMIKEFFKEKT